jgi:hypothetical protein
MKQKINTAEQTLIAANFRTNSTNLKFGKRKEVRIKNAQKYKKGN